MKILIVGVGKIGMALTERLSQDGHDVVVIDRNPKVLEECQQVADVMAVQGNGASMEVLREAGVESAELLIAAANSDEVNILCCLVAKRMTDIHTIARVRSTEYAPQMGFLRDEMGMSMVFSPEQQAAREIFHLLRIPSFLKRDRFAKGRVEIVEIKVTPDSVLCGRRLHELYELVNTRVLVCAVERDNTAHIPSGNFVLEEGDNIYVTADSKYLTLLIKNLGLMHDRIRQVILVGGSRTAYYLADRLLGTGVGVKIIEQDHERCVLLSTMLAKADIVEADGTRQDILLEEGINKTDALVSLTDIDEENLIVSLFAAQQKVPKVIAKINRGEYIETFQKLGVDTFINPKQLTCSDVVRYVRAVQNKTGGSVQALHYIVGGRVEALEFRASATTRNRGVPLADIRLRPNILIACITHGNLTIIPGGADSFAEGDTVIVVATAEQAITDLNDIFA